MIQTLLQINQTIIEYTKTIHKWRWINSSCLSHSYSKFSRHIITNIVFEACSKRLIIIAYCKYTRLVLVPYGLSFTTNWIMALSFILTKWGSSKEIKPKYTARSAQLLPAYSNLRITTPFNFWNMKYNCRFRIQLILIKKLWPLNPVNFNSNTIAIAWV